MFKLFKNDAEIVKAAREILYGRLKKFGCSITSTKDAINFLQIVLMESEREIFAVMFLNNRHGLISFEKMFEGTVNESRIYLREIIKRGLELSAAAIVVGHNHPSYFNKFSTADIVLTRKLINVAELVDIRVLDHFLIAGAEYVSFAEEGLM